jgi:hypothetical protein
LQRSDIRKADPLPKVETVSGSGPVDGGVLLEAGKIPELQREALTWKLRSGQPMCWRHFVVPRDRHFGCSAPIFIRRWLRLASSGQRQP